MTARPRAKTKAVAKVTPAKAKAKATPSAQARPTVKAAKPKAVKAAKPKVAPTSTHPPKPRTPAIRAVIEQVRAICMALPEATEVIAWAEPTWRVAGKQFAMFDTYHHGSPHLSVWIPAAPGAQAALIDAEPARFWRPPYVGSRGWVAVVVDDDPPWDMVAALIADAYQMIAPARLGR